MRSLFLSFLFITSIVTAQVTDNFTDGDFTASPVWSGDDSVYTIVANQLRSNKTIASSTFYLSTPSALANNCQWEFWVNLKFATSGANYVDIFLTSNEANLMSITLNGYFVRIGGTADNISLFKKTGSTNTAIITGTSSILTSSSNNIVKVKVTCDASNLFTLSREFSTSTITGNYTTEGSVTDASFTTSSFFGVSVRQSTASFFQKHFFDDFYVGPIIVDLSPPSIVSSTVISSTQVDVLFSENVDLTTSQTLTNYSANNSLGNPSVATRDGSNFSLVHLTFVTAFTSGLSNTLTVTNVQDFSANAITTANTNFTYFISSLPSFKDIIINEIFADPTPQVALPAVEFIEIYNRSINTINLNGWKFTDGSSTATLSNYNLASNQYLIICNVADTALFTPFGNRMGVSSFPSLNNIGDKLYLKDNTLAFIDSVGYSDTWYQNTTKKAGGWSLELINPNTGINCSESANWIASNNVSGGSPGTQNSVYSTVPAIAAPTISTSGSTTFCQGNNVTLTSSSGTSYLWSDNSITQSVLISASGNYSVTVTDTCGSATSSVTTVTVNPLPNISAGNNVTICTGQSTTLCASGGVNYSWAPAGQTTLCILASPTITSSYTTTATDANGCTNSDSVTITVEQCSGIQTISDNESVSIYPNPASDEVTVDIAVQQNTKATIEAFNTLGERVLYKEADLTKGLMQVKINVSQLAAGNYMFRITLPNKQRTEKIFIR